MGVIKNRHFGLDAVRAIAIAVVVLSHSFTLLTNAHPLFNHLQLFDGVDLFFVLSGLLIGQIILDSDLKKISSIKLFLFRRWLRTLPNYYLFLIINIALIYFGLAPGMLSKASIYYIVFLQNLFKPIDIMFWESWSLVVEEWFYLVLPAIIFIISRIIKSKHVTYLSSVLLLFSYSLISKFVFIHHHPTFNYNLDFRNIAIYRFDTLCFGLLLAYFTTLKLTILKSLKWAGLLIFFLYFMFRSDISNPILILYSSAIACSGLIVFFYNFPTSNLFFRNGVELTSKISYSMYLVHLPLFYVLKPYFINQTGMTAFLGFLTYGSLVYLISFINYNYFESYFLKLRDHYFTKNR